MKRQNIAIALCAAAIAVNAWSRFRQRPSTDLASLEAASAAALRSADTDRTDPEDSPSDPAATDDTATLHRVVKGRDVDQLRALLDGETSVHARDEDGNAPLHVAATPDVVALLLERGADPNVKNSEGHSPLHVAVVSGNEPVARTLVEKGQADPNLPATEAISLIHQCVATGRADTVRLLLSLGADVNLRDVNSLTPLSWAAAMQNGEIARLLLEAAADPDARDKGGCAPIHRAVANGDADMVKLLLEHGADADGAMRRLIVPLHTSETGSKPGPPPVRLTVTVGGRKPDPTRNWTPLRKTILDGNAEIEKMLLAAGATKGRRGEAGLSASRTNRSDRGKSLAQRLQEGADPNARDKHGYTLLHRYAMGGTREDVELLLKHGADIDARNDRDETALKYVLNYRNTPMALFLLQKGADPSLPDNRGDSPLLRSLLCRQYDVARALVRAGADLEVRYRGVSPAWFASFSAPPDILRSMLAKGVSVNALSNSGICAIEIAARRQLLDVVAVLEKHGAKHTPFSLAALGRLDAFRARVDADPLILRDEKLMERLLKAVAVAGHDRVLAWLETNGVTPTNRTEFDFRVFCGAINMGQTRVVRRMLDAGYQPGEEYHGFSPIHSAASSGHNDVIQLFLDRGIPVDLPYEGVGSGGQTPLHHAISNKRHDTVRFLVAKGADIHYTYRDGQTYVTHMRDRFPNLEMLELLLELGVDPRAVDELGSSPIQWAHGPARELILARLAETDAAPTAAERLELAREANRDLGGHRPLHAAARKGDTDGIRQLLKHGADVHALDKEYRTPLYAAVAAGHAAAIRLLIERGAHADGSKRIRTKPMDVAIDGGQCDVVYVLLDAGVRPGHAPLKRAVCAGARGAIEALVASGAGLNDCGDYQLPLLHKAVERDDIEMVRLLLCLGADPNARPERGSTRTPLHTAARKGNLAMVDLLLEWGVDPHAVDINNRTADDYTRDEGLAAHIRTQQVPERHLPVPR